MHPEVVKFIGKFENESNQMGQYTNRLGKSGIEQNIGHWWSWVHGGFSTDETGIWKLRKRITGDQLVGHES